MTELVPTAVLPGLRYWVQIPWTPFTVELDIAGQLAEVDILTEGPASENSRARIWLDGVPLPAAFHVHEAGLYPMNDGGYYCYEVPRRMSHEPTKATS